MNKLICLIFSFLILSSNTSFAIFNDAFIEKKLKNMQLTKPEPNLKYNFESLERIPIKLQIKDNLYTKKDSINEGQKVYFKITEDVFYNNKLIIERGSMAEAKITGYISRGFNGIPATIIINNFKVYGLNSKKLKGIYIKKGLNLTMYVLPIKWALTFLPPTGSFTNLIIGGNAKITKRDKITVYYYPKWYSENN